MSDVPECIYTAAQVRELDRRTIEDFGVPGYELMTRAGRFAFESLQTRWPDGPLLVVCGAGNNAGDGYVVARFAREAGRATTVCALVDPDKLGGDAATAWHDYRDSGGEVSPWDGELPGGAAVIVDALLGTGLDRSVEGRFADAVRAINDSAKTVMAVDLPSGLHADTGRVMGIAVRADLTTTFVGMKSGLLTGRGPALCGEILYHSLDAPAEAFSGVPCRARRLESSLIPACLTVRPGDAHKGLYGHVLVIGGGPGMPGAARMAGEAALRSGAGLVSVATLVEHVPAVSGGRPELMSRGVDTADDLGTLLERATVLALGPGLARTDWSERMFEAATATDLPLVVDADGLNLLADNPIRRDRWVLTPHPGEAARLLGVETAEIQGDRFRAAQEIAERYNAIVVLKGAGSLVQLPGGDTWLCAEGNPGMAVAGMGDVLTGVIAGIAAQCGDLAEASRCGVLVHALAGDDAAAEGGERGLLASDLLPFVRRRLNPGT